MTVITVRMPAEELNRRLEELSMKIERMSLLIEDTLIDPSDTISLDQSRYNDLILCLSRYEELLDSFRETTEDTAEEIRGIVGHEECFCDETDCDENIEVPEDDEDAFQ